MRRRMFKALMCLLMLTVFCGAFTTTGAFAAGGSLDISYTYKGEAISGAKFNLYKVAEPYGGGYVATSGFKSYSISFDMSQENVKNLAMTLSGYVSRDKIKPTDTDTTSSSGKARFTNLTDGLYLVIGVELKSGKTTYSTEPFIVAIPDSDNNYNISAEPKVSTKESGGGNGNNSGSTPPPGGGGGPVMISLGVMKVWDDASDTSARPESIVVQLLRNGSVYQEITLNKANNWKHTWVGMSTLYTWTVVEKEVPRGYTVSVRKEGTTFVVTNKRSSGGTTPNNNPGNPGNPGSPGGPGGPTVPTDNPGSPGGPTAPTDNPNTPEREDLIVRPTDDPTTPEREDLMTPAPGTGGGNGNNGGGSGGSSNGSSSSDGSGGSGSNSGSGSGGSGDGSKLPQTGQLWWPVPCTALLGMILLLYAYMRFNKRSGDNE